MVLDEEMMLNENKSKSSDLRGENCNSRPETNPLLTAGSSVGNIQTLHSANITGNVNPEENMKIISDSKCSHLNKWVSKKLSPDVLCPTSNLPLQIFTYLIFLLLLWGTSFTLFEDNVAPQSNLFILVSLFVLAYIAGYLISLVKLPPLLGMLIVGIIFRNVNIFNMQGPYKMVVANLRSIAMVVILIKAGLGLDADALLRLSFVVIRLAFTPCLVEAAVIACSSYFFLGLPWLWGALLGFVIGAVSPAVVVPSLLALKEKGYGEDKGISTLVIAASSIDDILAISGFGVILSTIFSEGNLTQQILQGPLEVVMGLSFGISWGLVAVYIPHKSESWMIAGRVFMVGAGGLFAVFGSQLLGYSGAGPLASIVMAFVACFGWKKQGWTPSHNPVEDVFSFIWQIFQPVLFGLIGTAIDFSTLGGQAIGYGIASLGVGLLIRLIVSFFVVCGSTLNLKERIFVAISWFPKATVQAAIGPVALDLAEKMEADDTVKGYASQVLTIAVISIIITAPLGAIGIYLSGPRLLGRVESEVKIENESKFEDNII